MDEQILFFNGIDAESGDYLRAPRSFWLSRRKQRVHREVRDDVDLKDLSKTGWGIVFAQEDHMAPAILEAMQPLLKHRRQQAALESERRYQEYAGDRGYLLGEGKQDFLTRQKTSPGTLDPDRVPYYLLLVGDPKTIPYRFQYQLDVPCAVGRIHFDSLDEYERYALSVVQAETQTPERPRKTVLFGPRHQFDPPTDISLKHLLEPLAKELAGLRDWEVSTVFAEEATKTRLSSLLGGEETPALLFTGGHGMGFGCGKARQRPCQGALLCQEWPGRGHVAPSDFYFSADDLDDTARLGGLISFHFACYSAGTPAYDGFSQNGKRQIAPEPFVARLPQRMLAHPGGGALAVVGHVDTACESSFLWKVAGSQVLTFAHTLIRLQDSYPVGAAMEPVNRRYAEISSDLFDKNDMENADEWEAFLNIACQDARNYVIVGDPAVRLPEKPKKKRVMRGG
ncbi:MAG TPA: hypothetical protein VNW71_05935 [Thermoanaerobaculia bacterium]|nr:hypothetical protein [Thermoanaerobaculia bacterium]